MTSPYNNKLPSWDNVSKGLSLQTYADFHNLYHWDVIASAFPWVRQKRAGFVVVHDLEMLIVEQKPEHTRQNGKYIFLPSRICSPKGQKDPGDMSALDTAERELFEETGINLSKISARMLPSTFVYCRPDVCEIIIYFIVFLATKPQITIDRSELCSYRWENMKHGMKRFRNVTKPTLKIFATIDDTALYTLKSQAVISIPPR
jgi:8-oxo-dGTP pyrophosphatase MutT (NUDIX family)